METILRNARVENNLSVATVDIGIDNGHIAVIEPNLVADALEIDLGGRLVTAGFVETHIHLDKSCILDRCDLGKGGLNQAIKEVAKLKAEFTSEDVYRRAKYTL